MNIKNLFRCAVSAVALSALVALAFLASGCDKERSSELVGSWYCEFYEEEWGGECTIGYIFKKNGDLTVDMSFGDEQGSTSMLWYTEGGKLYTLDAEDKGLYKETGIEWPSIRYKVSQNALDFYGEDGTVLSFTRKN